MNVKEIKKNLTELATSTLATLGRGASSFINLGKLMPTNENLAKYETDKIPLKPKGKHYIILGAPNSGKSVYFAVTMDYFQRKFNHKERGYSLTFCELYTDETVRGTMKALRRGEWPQHTQGADYHEVKFSFKNSQGMFITENLSFVDCGGETFYEIFCGAIDLLEVSATMSKECYKAIFGKMPSIQNSLSDEAQKVKTKIDNANGIIFAFSAETLKDIENDELATTMFNLLRYIEKSKNIEKLALVITKGDELGEKALSTEEAEDYFCNQQPSAFARLRTLNCEVKFFVVSAVKAVISDTGEKIPPVNYTSVANSLDIEKPIVWMLDMAE